MARVVKKASLRTSTLDYAKARVKAPTLAPVKGPAVNKTINDYSKFAGPALGGNQGPLTLDMLAQPFSGKPSKVRF